MNFEQWIASQPLLADSVAGNSEESRESDPGNGDNLLKVVIVPLTKITTVMIHRVNDPAVPLEDLSSRETVSNKALMIRAAGGRPSHNEFW